MPNDNYAGLNEEFEDQVRIEMHRCRHQRHEGINHLCALGIDVRALVGGPDLGWATRTPCFTLFEPKSGERAVCESYSPYTREEAEIDIRKWNERVEKVLKVAELAHADALSKGLGMPTRKNPELKGRKSSMPCPICEAGTLNYSVAEVNGHMWATCTTKGCAKWME